MNRSRLVKIGVAAAALAYLAILVLVLAHRHSSPSTSFPNVSLSPSNSSPGASPPAAPAQGRLFVGVAVNNPIAPSVRSFASVTGVHPAMVELYTSFGSPFAGSLARKVVAIRSTPFIQWNPRHAPLAKIARGAYDGYLRTYARAVKRFGHHIVLSFAHEMNGHWYSWSRPHATPAQYIAAWRRIHRVFARSNVTNVTWSWDPSHTGSPANQWWPGRAYVDCIGIDGYLRPGQTFAHIFANQLANIRSFTSKPVFIAETGVAPSPGTGSQIAALFHGLSQYNLLGFVWFDINRLKAWKLEGRPEAVKAFRSSVAQVERTGGLRARLAGLL